MNATSPAAAVAAATHTIPFGFRATGGATPYLSTHPPREERASFP